jgi:cysteinyl-tRNA synthetase
MHPEHLDLRGEKMSKSVGNIIGVGELLERHRYDEVRWFFATTHYRTRLAFAADLVDSAAEGYRRITNAARVLEARLADVPDDHLSIPVAGTYASLRVGDEAVPRDRHRLVHGIFGEANARLIDRFIAAMDDDLGAPQATAALFDYVGELFGGGLEAKGDPASLLAAYRCLTRHLHVLGIEMPNPRLYPELAVECMAVDHGADDGGPVRAAIDRLVELRQKARVARDFARADILRDLLHDAGITIEDTPTGPRWSVLE